MRRRSFFAMQIIMDINFLGYHYMRYNYWPYCKFSCKLLVLYSLYFHKFALNHKISFPSFTHGFGVQTLHCTHNTFSRCLRRVFISLSNYVYIFSDILQMFLACTVVGQTIMFAKWLSTYMHSLFSFVWSFFGKNTPFIKPSFCIFLQSFFF